MTRTATGMVMVLAAASVAAAQGQDGAQVMAQLRGALGGDKLAAVRTLAGTGRATRTGPGGNTMESDFELALETPDRYRLRTALVAMGNMSIFRHTGFAGDQVIEEIDQPPNLTGGNIVIRIAGPGGPMDPAKMTPEQKAEANRQRLAANRRDYLRLAIGMFGPAVPGRELQFTYAGQAEAPDGKADVLDVKGEDGFAARLFVDASSHLPLMLTWMDREPLVIQAGPGGVSAGTRTFVETGGGASHSAQPPGPPRSREEIEKDLEARRAEAEAKRRTVEFRVFYGDYKSVGGVKLPHRIQRAIDGKTTEEMVFESYKVNGKIDPETFKPTK
jgi:hypothetical protein